MRGLSLVAASGGYSVVVRRLLVAVCRLLVAVTSLAVERGPQ